jgi:polysaccharide biosynthesis protein PslH
MSAARAPKVLFTTPILEHPPAGGPQLRIENSIKALRRVSELHVASRVSRANLGGTPAERFYMDLSRSFAYTPSTRMVWSNRYLRKARTLLGEYTGYDVMADARALLDAVDRLGIDIVWFGYGNISYPLIRAMRSARPSLKMVCDTDSVWSRFVLRELPHAGPARRARIERVGRAKEAEERAFVDACDATTAVSDVDEAYYRSIASKPGRIYRFSNVIDVESYRAVPPAPASYRRPALFLGGTFGHYHSPMDTAARWFLESVMPGIRKAIPGIHLYIVGRGSDRTMAGAVGPSVSVLGKVASVLPYLCHCDVSLVPLHFESGTRFKILEAGACGIPIVSTTLGAEGLPVRDGEHVLLADAPEDFAEAVVALVRDRDLAIRLGGNLRMLVEEQFSLRTLEREASAMFGSLGI